MNLSRTPSAQRHVHALTSLFVDDQLDADARGIALLHLRDCPECTASVHEERAVRDLLQQAPTPSMSAGLFARLLAIGEEQDGGALSVTPSAAPVSASLPAAPATASVPGAPVGPVTAPVPAPVPGRSLLSAAAGAGEAPRRRLLTRPGSATGTRPLTSAPPTAPGAPRPGAALATASPARSRRLRRAARRLRHAAPVTVLAVALGAVVAAGGSALEVPGRSVAPSATLVTGAGGSVTGVSAGAGQGTTTSSNQQRRSEIVTSPRVTAVFVSVADTAPPLPVIQPQPMLEWHESRLTGSGTEGGAAPSGAATSSGTRTSR